MAASSNFDLEPVIADYFEKYPKSEFESYQVVFGTRDEHIEGSFSYIIVFERKSESTPPDSKVLKLYDFLKAYVEYNQMVEGKDFVLTMDPHGNVLPQLGRGGHTLGRLKRRELMLSSIYR